MRYLEPDNALMSKRGGSAHLTGITFLILCAIGCGGNKNNSGTMPDQPTAPTQGPQTYFASYVAGTTSGGATALGGPIIYSIDDFAHVFSQSTFQLNPPSQQGPQVINTGTVAAGQRGLLSLGITTNYSNSSGSFVATTYNPPKSGSFAIELAGQAGGLVQLVGQPVAPLVAATQCPNLKTAVTYQFLTIPGALLDSSTIGQQAGFWDPTIETAFGSVDVGSQASTVNFDNIHQMTLPSVGGSGSPSQQSKSPVTGTCGPTVFGSTITLGQLSVTNPFPGGGNATPPQASVAIGPTGLLVEYSGGDYTLGAGTGAVGLPKPSSALDTSALRDAQYLGFVYGAGSYGGSLSAPTGWSSHLTSFGFSSTPPSCASVAATTGTLIYGGDYTNDDPTTSKDGFGNCNLAIDLGTQDSSNNGLYPHATVWIGATYSANTTAKTYSLPAVAIAGQLNGKYAVFILGVDSTQPWAIYLLQSN
ncbi:MAG: hypothetical protein WDN23_05480 [Edaphobacter sp.]